MTTTFKYMQDDVLDLAGLKSKAVTLDKVKRWLNQGYKLFSGKARIPAKAQVLVTNQYTKYSLPNNYCLLLAVKVGVLELDKMDECEDDQATTNGSPNNYYQDGNNIVFYPYPQVELTADLLYYKYADALVNDGDILHARVPDEFAEGIISFAVMKAKSADEDYEAAKFHKDIYLQKLYELEKWALKNNAGLLTFELGD